MFVFSAFVGKLKSRYDDVASTRKPVDLSQSKLVCEVDAVTTIRFTLVYSFSSTSLIVMGPLFVLRMCFHHRNLLG